MSARYRFLVVLLVASALVFTTSSPARADFVPDPKLSAPSEPDPPPTLRWYGYQTLGVDALSAALLAGTGSSPVLGVVGYLGYLVGGPVVHGVHHRDGAVAADLLLRQAAPFAGFAIGAASAQCVSPAATVGEAFCPLAGGVTGILGAMATVSVFDAVVLAWQLVPSHPELAGGTMVPTLSLTASGGMAGLGGTF